MPGTGGAAGGAGWGRRGGRKRAEGEGEAGEGEREGEKEGEGWPLGVHGQDGREDGGLEGLWSGELGRAEGVEQREGSGVGGFGGGWAVGQQRAAEREERVGVGSVGLVRVGRKEKVTRKRSALDAAPEACLMMSAGSRGESQDT